MVDQNIFVLRSADPFADGIGSGILNGGPSDGTDNHHSSHLIHIRLQQRNRRQTLTTVQGIEEKYDKKLLLSAMKKKLACNGTVIEHEEYGEVIQLQGDQRTSVSEFLTKIRMCRAEQIIIHGY